MFVELLPILRKRPVMLTLAVVGNDAIRVNVIPKRLKENDSGDDALTTPLTVTGTPAELDRDFASQLVGFTDAFVKLGSNLAEVETAHAAALKTVEAERRKEIERRKGGTPKPVPAAGEPKPGPLVKDGKPVFGSKIAPAETPSLFDSHGTTPAPDTPQRADCPQSAGVPQNGIVTRPTGGSESTTVEEQQQQPDGVTHDRD